MNYKVIVFSSPPKFPRPDSGMWVWDEELETWKEYDPE